jgi:hypothetical protein
MWKGKGQPKGVIITHVTIHAHLLAKNLPLNGNTRPNNTLLLPRETRCVPKLVTPQSCPLPERLSAKQLYTAPQATSDKKRWHKKKGGIPTGSRVPLLPGGLHPAIPENLASNCWPSGLLSKRKRSLDCASALTARQCSAYERSPFE